jgi:protein-S-isoprenylcysteine O-methyltransferase Ste14
MRRTLAVLGSTIFLVLAPGIVAGYVPWRICRWHLEPPLLGTSSFRVVGVLLIAAGLPVLLDSFARFALQGLGTPAPIFPTRHLVVSGLFRYVRNPMYVAVLLLILGQGLLFASVRVLVYGVAVWVGFFLFVLIYEEPTLLKRYGREEFCANVPRWMSCSGSNLHLASRRHQPTPRYVGNRPRNARHRTKYFRLGVPVPWFNTSCPATSVSLGRTRRVKVEPGAPIPDAVAGVNHQGVIIFCGR